MTVHDDLALLRRRITNYASVSQDYEGLAALSRVEAEVARLLDVLENEPEAVRLLSEEVARLRDGLRRRNELIVKTIYNPPEWTGPDVWWADEARALLADQDGAA